MNKEGEIILDTYQMIAYPFGKSKYLHPFVIMITSWLDNICCLCIGLFVADQTLRRNGDYSSAIYTRQNPNGNRRGYECPEERDYYPYWHPTPWRDIAVLADNETQCDMFRRESNNRVARGICQETHSDGSPKYWSTYNNEVDCTNNSRKLLVSFYSCHFT